MECFFYQLFCFRFCCYYGGGRVFQGLLSVYFALSFVLVVGDIVRDRIDKYFYFLEFIFQLERDRVDFINKYYVYWLDNGVVGRKYSRQERKSKGYQLMQNVQRFDISRSLEGGVSYAYFLERVFFIEEIVIIKLCGREGRFLGLCQGQWEKEL